VAFCPGGWTKKQVTKKTTFFFKKGGGAPLLKKECTISAYRRAGARTEQAKSSHKTARSSNRFGLGDDAHPLSSAARTHDRNLPGPATKRQTPADKPVKFVTLAQHAVNVQLSLGRASFWKGASLVTFLHPQKNKKKVPRWAARTGGSFRGELTRD